MVVPWRLHFHPNTDSFYCTYLAGQDPLTEQVSPRRWVCVDGWFNLCAFTLSVQCALIARCTTESIQCDSGQVGGHTHTHTHRHTHSHFVPYICICVVFSKMCEFRKGFKKQYSFWKWREDQPNRATPTRVTVPRQGVDSEGAVTPPTNSIVYHTVHITWNGIHL